MNDKATILFGQFADYNQIIKSGKDIQSVHHTVVNTLCEKYECELVYLSHYQHKISFARPENAIQFALNISNRFHQEPRIPYKIGIALTEDNTHEYNIAGSGQNLYRFQPCPLLLYISSMPTLFQ